MLNTTGHCVADLTQHNKQLRITGCIQVAEAVPKTAAARTWSTIVQHVATLKPTYTSLTALYPAAPRSPEAFAPDEVPIAALMDTYVVLIEPVMELSVAASLADADAATAVSADEAEDTALVACEPKGGGREETSPQTLVACHSHTSPTSTGGGSQALLLRHAAQVHRQHQAGGATLTYQEEAHHRLPRACRT